MENTVNPCTCGNTSRPNGTCDGFGDYSCTP